ncbi:MAG: D-glycero-beta-D-manno-heptose 1-phosphate adenylyltransferase [Bacteroidia bacterium]|nr:D-glycero-beta-D-manno-heptose 1-phosphate adenylyltransferase [Bacteroidia bacterium]
MTHIESIHSKIHTWETLKTQVATWQSQGKKIVFSNGCFDLVHKGHIDYLNRAADLGDVLVMGLNTDASVSKLKGPHRPIQDEQSRLLIMAALQCVSAVILFNEETPYDLIKLVQPDVLVKGSDYQPENIVGYDIVTAKGGTVKTIDFLPGYSTSAIEKRIKAC